MFRAELQERIQLMEPELVKVSDQSLHLTEKGEGEADLEIQLVNKCILIQKLENSKPEYFLNKKCADYVIFENTDTSWKAHIFEMKKTISTNKWETEIKKQFHGAIQNILALSGILGIEITDIILHTVYRNDKINDMANLAKKHFCLHCKNENRSNYNTEKSDWNDVEISLKFLDRKKFKHNKIKLDLETGTGKYNLQN